MSFLLLDPLNCVYIIYIHIYIITCNSLNHYYFFVSFIPIYCLRAPFPPFFYDIFLFFNYFSNFQFTPSFSFLPYSIFRLFQFFSQKLAYMFSISYFFFRSVTPFSSKFHFSPFIILRTFKSFSLLLLTNYFTHFHSPLSFPFWFPPVPISFDFSSRVPDFYPLPFFSSRSSAAPLSSVLFPAIPFFSHQWLFFSPHKNAACAKWHRYEHDSRNCSCRSLTRGY